LTGDWVLGEGGGDKYFEHKEISGVNTFCGQRRENVVILAI
jgi:hypothetical protein